MGGEVGTFTALLGHLEKAIESFPDRRTGHNCLYSMRDAALSAFSVFHIQCASFLSHQQLMRTDRGENIAKNLFCVHEIPTDSCIRMLLEPVAPQYSFPIDEKVH